MAMMSSPVLFYCGIWTSWPSLMIKVKGITESWMRSGLPMKHSEEDLLHPPIGFHLRISYKVPYFLRCQER